MAARRPDILPPSLAPIGIGREGAAAFLDIGATLFDRLVADGIMPQPRALGGRLVWDIDEIARAFRAIPHRAGAEGLEEPAASGNPWDAGT